MHKIIKLVDAQRDIEYALLIVPLNEINTIKQELEKLAREMYNFKDLDCMTVYDSIVNFLYTKYNNYIDWSPIIIKVK